MGPHDSKGVKAMGNHLTEMTKSRAPTREERRAAFRKLHDPRRLIYQIGASYRPPTNND